MKPYLLLLLCFLGGVGFVSQTPQTRPTEVLLLGTHYLPADILRQSRQRELDEIVESLARFHADRVLLPVEMGSQEEALLNERLQAYRDHNEPLNRSIEEQLGLRLAASIGQERIYGFLQNEGFAMNSQSPELLRFQREAQAIESAKQSQVNAGSIQHYLSYLNHPQNLQHEHSAYVQGLSRVGAGTDYAGADLLTQWYGYHARIFANITRLSQGAERIVFMVDSRHIPVLQELLNADPAYKAVSVMDFLLVK